MNRFALLCLALAVVVYNQCPQKCPPNEVFDPCFNGCEANCTPVVRLCPSAPCGPGGCRCADGFVRNLETHLCIPQCECLLVG